jgi:hypothetical protein
MTLPDEARATLAFLMARFEAKGKEYPDLGHVLISNPHPAPVVLVPPPGADLLERLAYAAAVKADLAASRTPDRVEMEGLLRVECEPELIEWARREGMPARQATSIVRDRIRAAIEATTAYLESPFARAHDEIVRMIYLVSRLLPEEGKRVVFHFALKGHPAQVFLDRGPDRGSFDAFAELAESAVEMLAGLGLLEPTEARPEPSYPHWAVLQWMLFVYRYAMAHPKLALLSPEFTMMYFSRLEHGGQAQRLLLNVFASSAVIFRQFLDEGTAPDRQGPPSVGDGSLVASPNDDRNRFCYERYLAKVKIRTIREAVNKTPGWARLITDTGVYRAVKSYCKDHMLSVPRRKDRRN